MFAIKNADDTPFHDLVLHKATYDSVVMSLGDKITGDVYYKDTSLAVTMKEYIVYNNVRYILVNPPTIVREGMVANNSELKGMTKYSFTFYHPMCLLGNFPFSDVAVGGETYLSHNKTFAWIGTLADFVAKINSNLIGTEWVCEIGNTVQQAAINKMSDVMSFDKNSIADALKTGYDTWKIPYIIDIISSGDSRYAQDKHFLIRYGLPSEEILDTNNQPYVFRFGKGVGLKNNSRTPRNNKIVTRIVGYGSENNIPYGYPQIVWNGSVDDSRLRYPLYDGIVNGQWAKLIKHPFTRTHLMPSVYTDAVNKKVNPRASGYNPNIELVDYYDADSSGGTVYPNPINPNAPSVEIHEFDIKPELGNMSLIGVHAYEQKYQDALWPSDCISKLVEYKSESDNYVERQQLDLIIEFLEDEDAKSARGKSKVGSYSYEWSITTDEAYAYIDYKSSILNFSYIVVRSEYKPYPEWDDTMDEEGNYRQSYFRITLPILPFDLYACASITEQMSINMRSGACKGCTFPVMIDWDDYKINFYDSDGNFDPAIGDGHPRKSSKYPDSRTEQITVIVQKEYQTFGVLMPNTFQRPYSGDQFVILGISLPQSYITSAEQRLDNEMKQYMLDNNVYYFDYPLNFDAHFLATHTSILSQIKPNVVVRFDYNNETIALYVKQMSIKWGQSPLPQYDIVLTDDVEIVLNPIGKVIDDVSKLRTDVENGALIDFDSLAAKLDERYDQRYLSKTDDDTGWGTVRLLKGLQVGEQFVSGLLGSGAVFRNNDDGTTYLEVDKMYVRMRAYFDTLEIRRFIHSGGNRIASLAGIKCSRVEYIDANGDKTNDLEEAVKFRCYFRAVDNGNAVTNDFLVGDLAFCKETNASVGEGLEQHGYWRAVVGVSSTPENDEHYIDLSKIDCLEDSGIPQAQDDIIQLGNKTDTTRQGAIIEYVGGENAPSYQIYQGINDYSLVSKNYVRFGYNSQTHSAEAYIGNPDGSSYIWYHNVTQGGITHPQLDIKAVINAQSNIGDKTLEEYIQDAYDTSDIWEAIGDLQSQIDGEIDTWYYEGVPTLNNAPAVDWTTDSDKNNHLGDLYYNKTDGSAYRFVFDEDDNTYKWVEIHDDAVSEALRIANEAKDTADSKRRVFLTDAQHPHPNPPYDEGDLWVNAVWPAAGQQGQGSLYNDEILKCIETWESGPFRIEHWGRASNKFENWVTNEYADTIQAIGNQVDKKAETWYQGTNPANSWNTNELKAQHVGDLWYCTQDISGTDFKKDTTWRYTDKGQSANPRYVWQQQYVPKSVFDAIDGKNAIYTAWGDWGENLKERDLLIPSADIPASPQTGNVAYKANKVYRCTNVGNTSTPPTFVEISYTDDTVFNNYIQQILNGTDETSDSSIVAQALHAIKEALLENTTIDGGLILTNLVAMRSSNKVWAGISGQYKTQETGSGWKGHGIAAWYGGGMADWEVYKETHPTETINDSFAKSLFRFDGSGYLAGGNITWDSQGRVAIKDITTLIGGNDTDVLNALTTFNSAFHFNTQQGTGTILSIVPQMPFASLQILENGTANNVATRKWVDDNYVSIGFFNKLFQAYKSTTISDANKVLPNDVQTTINNLKIMVGTWTQQYVSALGLNDSGSSGGAQVLDDLLDVTISNPTQGQVLKYRVVNGVGGWYNAADESGVGTVTQVKVGNTAYNPTNGVVSLPAYPTTLPASDVSAWAKAVTKPTYTFSEITGKATAAQIPNIESLTNFSTRVYDATVTRTKNTVLAAPDGSNGAAAFRALVAADIPSLSGTYVTLTDAQIISGVKTFGSQIVSTVSDGTMPLGITSQTLVTNLNADLLDNYHAFGNGTYNIIKQGYINIGAINEEKWYKIASVPQTVMERTLLYITTFYVSGGSTTSGSCLIELTTRQDPSYLYKSIKGLVGSLPADYVRLYYNTYTDAEEVYVKFPATSSQSNRTVVTRVLAETRRSGQKLDNIILVNNENIEPTSGWSYVEMTYGDFLGNVASATKLATERTIWGRPFDGTANVSGDMSGVGSIDASGNISVTKSTTANASVSVTNNNGSIMLFTSTNRGVYDNTTDKNGWIIATNGTNTWLPRGNVGIGTTTPDVKLTVSGAAKVTDKLYLYKPYADRDDGAVYLKYESSNGGIHLFGGGFYADTYVSALGLSNSGGSGGVDWDALAANTNEQINVSHLTAALAPYALTSQIPTLLPNPYALNITVNGTLTTYNGSATRNITIDTGLDESELISYLSNKTLTLNDAQSRTIGSWTPTAAGSITVDLSVLRNLYTSRPTTANVEFSDGGLRTFKATSSMANADGKPNHDAHIIHAAWDTSAGWNAQIALFTSGQGMRYRGQTNHNWSDWKTVLDSDNSGITNSTIKINGTSLNVWSQDNFTPTDYVTLAGAQTISGVKTFTTQQAFTVAQGTSPFTVTSTTKVANLNADLLDGFIPADFLNRYTSSKELREEGWYRVAQISGYGGTILLSLGATYNHGVQVPHTMILSMSYYSSSIKQLTRGAEGSDGLPNIGHISNVRLVKYSAGAYYVDVYYNKSVRNTEYVSIGWLSHFTTTYITMVDWTPVESLASGETESWNEELTYLFKSDALQTSRTLWGQTFDGTADVSGNMTGVGSIDASGNITITHSGTTASRFIATNGTGTVELLTQTNRGVYDRTSSTWLIGTNGTNTFLSRGNVGIGKTSPEYKLDVNGAARVSELWIGGVRIIHDTDNGGLRVVSAGLYADDYLSALGVGDVGGGGGVDLEAVWTSMEENNSSHWIHLSHIQSALSSYLTSNNYATQSWVTGQSYATQTWVNNQGFIKNAGVTSVSMSVPSGLKVNGGVSATISSTGTFDLTFENGYSIPTDSSQTLWDTAYATAHTHSNKSVLDGITSTLVSHWNTAYTNNHTHSNKSVLDGITSTKVDNWDAAYSWGNHGAQGYLTETSTVITTLQGYFDSSGSAKSAVKMKTARTINGTSFNGTANITTANWGTARNISISDADATNTGSSVSVNGSAAVTLLLPSTIKASLSGNATTATTASKLSTVSKTAWGQTYWTSGGVPTNVSGSIDAGGNGGVISSFHSIELNNYGTLSGYGGFIDFHYNGSSADYTLRIIEENSGLLALRSPYTLGLLVGGNNGDYVQIGQIRIVYDSSNNALRVQSPNGGTANLYATGGVSALGIGEESGSGSDATFDTLTVESGLWVYDEIHCTSDIYGDNLYINNDAEVSTLYYEYLRQSSDMRLKDVVRMVDMDVETIGRAPLFEFRWKSRPDTLNIGTSAQYWKAAMPQVVGEDRNHYLSMDYATTALAGVISVARKVMTHEERIAALESENERLRNEIETLKAA